MPKWFESWFDSEYYHLLYSNRDETEASRFIENVCRYLQLDNGAAIADIACGKGRHSRVLASLGFAVAGLDISPASIEYAQAAAGEHEQYFVHDMRQPFPLTNLDAAMNLFTSFGYFEDNNDDLAVLNNIKNALKTGGLFIQDYLNPTATLSQLKAEEQVKRGEVRFDIRRYLQYGFIKKDIKVSHGSEELYFQESVKVYSADRLRELHEMAGFKVLCIFGDYSLAPFAENSSPRIILVSQKPHSQNESGSTAV